MQNKHKDKKDRQKKTAGIQSYTDKQKETEKTAGKEINVKK